MMKPNYGFAKRQRDLAKKQKKEEKRLKKAAMRDPQSPETETPPEVAPVVDDKTPARLPGGSARREATDQRIRPADRRSRSRLVGSADSGARGDGRPLLPAGTPRT